MTEKNVAQPTGMLPSLFGNDPFPVLRREMNDLLSRFSPDGGWFSRDVLPTLDLAETDDAFEIKVDVPNFKSEEIDVEVRGDLIQIRGEHKTETKEEKGKTYHRIERRSGAFSRTLTLPCRVNEQKVSANCKEGVLTINLPKVEGARTHKVKVQS